MTEQELWSQEEASLAANIAAVRAQIVQAASKVGREPEDITLVAVSKTKPLEMIQQAYRAGLRDFGENRVQEALSKSADFRPPDIRWHMIGHLQTNKVGKVAGVFACIHSVDSLHVAEALERHAAKVGVRQQILLEVNVAGEVSKTGMGMDEAIELARQIVELSHLDVQGLMTVAPQVEHIEEVRPVFRKLRLLRDKLRSEVPQSGWLHLSMGMTDDYRVAIEEGATIVRIGRAIFGTRLKKGEA